MPVADTSALRAELHKILASPVFVNSPRMTRFLSFVVEETLAGNSNRIKEYAVALEVFDKSADFDPQADSTVRTEASKLRSRLKRYYETEGREDLVVISIPKGAYVPVFQDRRNGTGGFRWPAAVVAAVGVAVAAGLIWRASVSSGPPPRLTPLTSYPELEEHPSLSPDGSQVAFRWKGDIYVKQVEGEGLVQITKDPAPEDWPAWSPDGRQIAFVRNGEVFLVSSLGGAERKVAESLRRAVWMPDGSALLVNLKTSPYAQSIFQVSTRTGEKRRLTFPNDASRGDADMALSPDGRTLAFHRFAPHGVYVLPIAGGEARQLTSGSRPILGLAWTPDGREIVFSSDRQGWSRLWRVPAQPAAPPESFPSPQPVEGAGDDARYPWISRPLPGQSARLAYQRFTRNFDIRRLDLTSPQSPSAPFIASTRAEYTPAYSPDGKKIAFVSNRSGARELWICEMDGSNPFKLTSFAGPEVTYPRWSPDGRVLVFYAPTGPQGNFESYTIALGGGVPQRLQRSGGLSMAHPVFSHDGRWLYFIPTREGAVEAWKMPAGGGEATQITRNGAFRPEESPDGKLLYYGKYGTNGLWSIPVEGGQERRILDSITAVNWTVTSKGIYYFDFAVAPDAPKLIKFYSFQTGKVNQVGTVEPTVSADYAGISVSPDGHWLLYSHIASASSDLMLVDPFR